MVHKNLIALVQQYKLEGPGPALSGKDADLTLFEKGISVFIGVLTLVAVIFFVLQIIFAGYIFISSSGDPKKMEVAKNHLIQNLIGFIIVVTAMILGSLIASIFGLKDIFDITKFFTTTLKI